MAEPKTVKFQIYLPEDLRTRFKAKCVVSGVTMNETAVKLIEGWTEEDKLPDSSPTPQHKAKLMSGKEFMALATAKTVRDNYYQLLSSNRIEEQRLKALASGDKPTDKEYQDIREILKVSNQP